MTQVSHAKDDLDFTTCAESVDVGLSVLVAESDAPAVIFDAPAAISDAIPPVEPDAHAALPSTDTSPLADTARTAKPGPLTSLARGLLTLHTSKAIVLYAGAKRAGKPTTFRAPGGVDAADAIHALYRMTARDNPYADWLLIQIDQRLRDLRQRIHDAHTEANAKAAARSAQGLAVSPFVSSSPRRFDLPVDGPYRFAIAALMGQFDACVRVTKTLVMTDAMSDIEGHQAIQPLVRSMRGLFGDSLAWARKLRAPTLRGLKRNDYLPGADAGAGARIVHASELFGPIPVEVFFGVRAPRHSLGQPNITSVRRAKLAAASANAELFAQPEQSTHGEPKPETAGDR